MINTTINAEGRFCNHFFRNMACHFIAKKNNISFTYSFYEETKKLGINLFVDGNNYYNLSQEQEINEENFFEYVSSSEKILKSNIKLKRRTTWVHNNEIFYAQTSDFAKYLKLYFLEDDVRRNICNNNIFKNRYMNNDDVFVHVRLGDVPHLNPGFEYYDSVLSRIEPKKGYISSDSINHDICQNLIKKYNLDIISLDEVGTIMFGSTCKNIVLSNGTFSWVIGLFGFYSDVYYPNIENKWHGDIFVFPEWYEVIVKKNEKICVKTEQISLQKHEKATKSFIINLDRRQDRLEEILKRISETELKNEIFIRFQAVDGQNISLKTYSDIIEVPINKIQKTIPKGEFACFMSHLFLIKHIINDNSIADDEYIKIFEDDFFYSDNFMENYKKLLYIDLSNIDFLYLGGRFSNNFDVNITSEDLYVKTYNENIYKRLPVLNYGHNILWDRINCSYMVRKSICSVLYKKIILSVQDYFKPMDTIYLSLHNCPDIKFYDFYPHLFWSPYNYKSDIQGDNLKEYLNIKISYIGFWPNFNPDDNIFNFNQNIIVLKSSECINADIIFIGSFIDTNLKNLILNILINSNKKLILYITEPIGKYLVETYNLMNHSSPIFSKIIGCTINKESTHYKYPLYINNFDLSKRVYDNSSDEILSKKFACLINRHDDGNTRTGIYNLLRNIDKISCPGKLFNNCDNSEINRIGNPKYINQFIFNICPENFKTDFEGYITEKILNACLGGAIPIYFGHFDEIDGKIFNKNRIIFFNPFDQNSLEETYNFVKNLWKNSEKLIEFYKQDIFCDTAEDTIRLMKDRIKEVL